MSNSNYPKTEYPDWLNSKGKDIAVELRELKNSRISGMDKFKKERSKILQLTYMCMENTNNGFGECQKKVWALKKE
jgi:hypothetical protein